MMFEFPFSANVMFNLIFIPVLQIQHADPGAEYSVWVPGKGKDQAEGSSGGNAKDSDEQDPMRFLFHIRVI